MQNDTLRLKNISTEERDEHFKNMKNNERIIWQDN